MTKPGLFLLSSFLIALSAPVSAEAKASPDSGRQAEILYLLKHDCGSCHGMRLQGGLGPALSPERLKHWKADHLAITILHGRPGTPMPPWHPFLSDQEALWLAGQLKQGVQP